MRRSAWSPSKPGTPVAENNKPVTHETQTPGKRAVTRGRLASRLTAGPSFLRGPLSRSKDRLIVVRQGRYVVIEERVIVLRADIFQQGPILLAPEALHRRPLRGERSWILDCDHIFQHLAAIDPFEALDDVELLGVRSPVIVDEGLG